MLATTLYSILRVLLDAIGTSQRDQAKLQAEVLALRRQVQVLERQIKRVRWTPADRMVLAALRDRLPGSAWAALRVQPETVLGWHRDLVRRRWAGYRDRPTGVSILSENHVVSSAYSNLIGEYSASKQLLSKRAFLAWQAAHWKI